MENTFGGPSFTVKDQAAKASVENTGRCVKEEVSRGRSRNLGGGGVGGHGIGKLAAIAGAIASPAQPSPIYNLCNIMLFKILNPPLII